MPQNSFLRELIEKVKKGEVIFFLGAGVSKVAGAPLSKEIIDELKETFPRAESTAENFLDVCQDIVDTPGYGKPELERFIRDKFWGLQPTESHLYLPHIKTPAVFTTNYDELIERAYEQEYSRSGAATPKCRTIIRDDIPYSTADVSTVKLFKLMGTINADDPSESMVLTRGDYNFNSKKRRRMLDTLSDFIKGGTLVYIGYSLLDRLVFEIIDEAYAALRNPERVPFSYALLPGFRQGTKLENLLMARRIIPIPISFDDFLKETRPVVLSRSIPKEECETIRVGTVTVKIKSSDIRRYKEYFEILTEERCQKEISMADKTDGKENIRRFFKGDIASWMPFIHGWDFQRDFYERARDRVQKELKESKPEDNRFLLIHGPAGIGKSLLLRRLAYEAAKGGNAVINLVPYRDSFDYKLIDSFCEEIITQTVGQGTPVNINPKIILILDDVSSNIRHVKRLITYLKSRAKPVLLIGAARTNEWITSKMRSNEQFAKADEIIVPEGITGKECVALVKHLIGLDILPKEMILDETFWQDRIQEFYEGSFFATVYGLVTDAKKRLEDIIADEYKALDSLLSKRAYEYVCCFYRYGIPLKAELLVRTLAVPYSEFIEQVYKTEARNVICELEGPYEGIYYSTRQRLIAEKLTNRIFNSESLIEKLLDVLRHINPFDKDEMETVRALLVTRLGPNSPSKEFNVDQRRRLYDMILQNEIEDSAILHHYGILEMDFGKDYPKAVDLMKRALAVARSAGDFTEGESRRNILTSLGGLYSRMATQALESGNQDRAEELHALADDCYSQSTKEDPTNPFPFHSKAFTRKWRAQKAKERGDQESSILLLCEALEVIEQAKTSVPDEALGALLELESEVHLELGDYAAAHSIADRLMKTKPRDARGYFLKGKLLEKEARREGLKQEDRRAKLEKALEHLARGREAVGDDKNILRTICKIFGKLNPRDYTEQHKQLSRLYSLLEMDGGCTDLELLFHLGVASFQIGEIDGPKGARRIFQELEEKSSGHPKRVGLLEFAWDSENNKERIFSGIVKDLRTRKDGFIQSKQIGWISFYRPAQSWTVSLHETVQFNVAFNYRGMLAVNLRK